MHTIPRIVISGGPCAGKSTSLARIAAWCLEKGFYPLISPEAATILKGSGLQTSQPGFQNLILQHTMQSESLRLRAALGGHYPNPVIICDRGLMDGQAYMYSPSAFEAVLKEEGLDIVTARDEYSGVIFLDSAACGAEEFYTTENNDERDEDPEEARVLNQKTLEAWHGTPHLIQIDNRAEQSFDDKMHRSIQALARILGIPEPIECERKIRILNFTRSMIPASAVPIDIVQTYLVNNDPCHTERVRARGQHNRWLYFHTIKEPLGAGEVIEHDRIISRKEYENLLVRKDQSRKTIYKTRHCFSHREQYCELDVFGSHLEGEVILEVELQHIDQVVDVPDFLGAYEDVTENPAYSNAALAAA